MRDRLMLEYPEKMCEYCCNFDKEHIGMDGTALCKLTMTLAYAEDYGGNCMFYNVPKEKIIVPPVSIGQTIYRMNIYNDAYREATVVAIYYAEDKKYHPKPHILVHHGNERGRLRINFSDFGKTVFLTKELAEKALAERSGE